MDAQSAQLLLDSGVKGDETGVVKSSSGGHRRPLSLSPLYPVSLMVATIIWAVAWHGDAVVKMVQLWWRSETFAHGLVIYPITLWLIYRARTQLSSSPIRPCAWALIPISLVSFLALLGELSSVDAAREFGIVAMLPLIVWCVLGTALVRTILFPLAFTLLAVPVGEFMLPVLMEHTADFTVAALRVSGIPVYREGLFFTVPSGNWSVVEACSGLRYLIASATLGCLFAYLSYRSGWRRILFVLASILVPIVANWVRAYMIVMIGHLSGMQLAVGVDHLLYGWIFFGVVMLLLFWVGSFWREDHLPLPTLPVVGGRQPGVSPDHGHSFAIVAIASAVISAAAPTYAAHLAKQNVFDSSRTIFVAPTPPWTEAGEGVVPDFVPSFLNARLIVQKTFTADAPIGLFLGYYANQSEGRELISHGNELIGISTKRWHAVYERQHTVLDGRHRLGETMVRSGEQELLVWHLYWIGGHWTVRKHEVKIRQAIEKLMGRGDGSAVLALYTRAMPPEQARQRLEAFMASSLPQIDRQLRELGATSGSQSR